MVLKKTAEYVGSLIAKRVLKNRPDLHKKFDEIMRDEVDPTMSNVSKEQMALKILRESKEYKDKTPGLSGLGKKSMGGEIEIKKGSDYIKDLL
tara:strand:- start:216 stop:494 length:279 start_codon:yes stop_codon:yes gene_type:complete